MKSSLLDLCLQTALSNLSKHPQIDKNSFLHYCFIIQRNKVLEWGVNRSNQRTYLPLYWGYPKWSNLHAEIVAYKKARGLLEDYSWEAINIRLNRRGELRNSFPCKPCFNLLKTLGCKYIYFTTQIGFGRI